MFINKDRPGGIALLAAVFCLAMAIFELYLGQGTGGVPPEFLLFVTLSAIFALLWYSVRKR
jgi:membrane protein implicated in regulation of membrane protease activity